MLFCFGGGRCYIQVSWELRHTCRYVYDEIGWNRFNEENLGWRSVSLWPVNIQDVGGQQHQHRPTSPFSAVVSKTFKNIILVHPHLRTTKWSLIHLTCVLAIIYKSRHHHSWSPVAYASCSLFFLLQSFLAVTNLHAPFLEAHWFITSL